MNMISEVYDLYRQGRIPACIFSQWATLNGGGYQMSESVLLRYLWPARIIHIDRLSLDDQPLKELDDVPTWLLFYSSGGDKAHTNLDLATLLFQLYTDNHPGLTMINDLLAIAPLGRYNVWLTAVTILLIGTTQSRALVRLALSDCACCLSTTGTAKYFKAISTAIRRTQVFPNGTAASLEDISVWAYWELPIGRDGNKSDWETEKRNRTTVIEMDSLEPPSLEQKAYLFLRKQFDALPQIPTDLQSWASDGKSGWPAAAQAVSN
ncbi:Hypothetical protein FKW44_018983 [Caligus rogercresseyi]|uniref:Uncharacterized protein n=1 Tax=Caligus rogercresseyi TaxID=217165 RepID=A0A7T8GVN8_CALRO|nr:Hypothetical protein FKW44_018983 [Caligus rogercresseyi]